MSTKFTITPSLWRRNWQPSTARSAPTVRRSSCTELETLLHGGALDPLRALPPLWHWAALSEWGRPGSLGPDGHPARGAFLPPVPYPRRMFAGGRLTFGEPLSLESATETVRRVTSVVDKVATTPLVVVTVEQEVLNRSGGTSITEHQDLAFTVPRPSRALERTSDPVHGPAMTKVADGHWTLQPSSLALMRFSAATSNSHRIHFDADYARGVEGYPGLVVHGPLIAIALAEVLRQDWPGRALADFSFRAHSPAFYGEVITLIASGPSTSDQITLTAASPERPDAPFMTAVASFVRKTDLGTV